MQACTGCIQCSVGVTESDMGSMQVIWDMLGQPAWEAWVEEMVKEQAVAATQAALGCTGKERRMKMQWVEAMQGMPAFHAKVHRDNMRLDLRQWRAMRAPDQVSHTLESLVGAVEGLRAGGWEEASPRQGRTCWLQGCSVSRRTLGTPIGAGWRW